MGPPFTIVPPLTYLAAMSLSLAIHYTTMPPLFFPTPTDFREWLAQNHNQVTEVWVGFYKVGSGKPSITWPAAVDQALCYGWIDGIRKSIDAESYQIRFTPRKPNSIWSAVNLQKVQELINQGLMQPAGLAIYNKRKENNAQLYSFEQAVVELSESDQKELASNEKAWNFFQSQAPSYRKAAIWWVISAKTEATRRKRLTTLISDSEVGQRLAHLTRPKK
jgi:uncharacterized protein YdeI (YjbR/CyaY-like superfamily)